MKFLDVAVFILCLNIAASLVNASGLIPTAAIQPEQDVLDKFTSAELQNASYMQSEFTSTDSMGLGDIAKSLFYFITNFAFGVIAVPYLFNQFGIPWWIGGMISIPIYAMYLVGIIQFIRGFSLESAQ